MEYNARRSQYLLEVTYWVNKEAEEGFTLKSLVLSDGDYLAVMERERAEGT